MTNIVPDIQIYESLPEGFSTTIQAAGIYVKVADKLLFLEYADTKPETGKCAIPGGKIEAHETPIQGARRELFEETGITIESENALQPLGTVYIRKTTHEVTIEFVFHVFGLNIDTTVPIHLSTEHRAYTWTTIPQVKDLSLVLGGQYMLDFYIQKSAKKTRSSANVNT